MIDPLTAIAAASAAYKGLTKIVQAGQELESCTESLGKWFGALNDINRAEEQRKRPPLHAKLMGSGSIEEEAFAILTHKKKMAEQEKEIKFMLNMRFGPTCWDEMLELRRRIKKEREETIYAAEEFKTAMIDGAIMVALSCGILGFIFGGVWLLGKLEGWW
jgi:hypothetical protein|tara:strand:+ start:443 stop:925 length:483 start_codon:yes stop_codon:yes gene_type:complete